jgi:hypothetical protein
MGLYAKMLFELSFEVAGDAVIDGTFFLDPQFSQIAEVRALTSRAIFYAKIP